MHWRQERRDIECRKIHEKSHDCTKGQSLVFDGAAKKNGGSVKQEDAHCHDGSSKQEKGQYRSPRFVSISFPADAFTSAELGMLTEPLTLAISTLLPEFLPQFLKKALLNSFDKNFLYEKGIGRRMANIIH